jgi:hypothetical protein
MRTTAFLRIHRFGFLLLLLLLMMASGSAALAQGINISPVSGPPGTTVFISNSDPQFPAQCFVNGNYIGDVPAGGSISVTINDPVGSVIPIGCRYEFEGPLTTVINFTVTAADSDGDGIPDDQDACPTQFWQGGNGCPDSDGDGVPDNLDQCPQQPAATQNGCPLPTETPIPDTDGDGLPDNVDACPTEFFQGGNGCPLTPTATPTVTVVPTATPTPTATPQAFIVPTVTTTLASALPNVGSVPVEFGDLLDACANLTAQAARLPASQIIRILSSNDPCGNLTNFLRDLSFGGVRPPAPGAQALTMRAQCSTDPRPYPTPEAISYLNRVFEIEPELAALVQSRVQQAMGSLPGSQGDTLICALMRGDGFVVGAIIRRNLNELGGLWTAMCMPPAQASSTSALYQQLGYLQFFRPPNDNPNLLPYEAGLIIALTSQEVALATRTQSWCGTVFRTQTTGALTPEEQQVAGWLAQCGVLDDSQADALIRTLRSGGVEFNNPLGAGRGQLTWAALLAFYQHYNGQCPPEGPYALIAYVLSLAEPSMPQPPSLPGFDTLPPETSFAAQLYFVQCQQRDQITREATAPPGCVASPVYRYSSSSSGRRPTNPFLNLPDDPFGTGAQAAVSGLQAELLHYVIVPNHRKDSFEQPIVGATVHVHNGVCAPDASAGRIGTVTTDANGVFAIENLIAGASYCAWIDALLPENSAIMGSGSWWWNPLTSDLQIRVNERSPYTRMGINFNAPALDTIQPVRQYGWLRDTDAQALNIVYTASAEDLIGALLPQTQDALDGELQPFSINVTVFDDLCDRAAWDGTLPNVPANCLVYESIDPARPLDVAADGEHYRAGEAGIPGIEVALYEGSCGSGRIIETRTTDDNGTATFNLLPTTAEQRFCAVVDANSGGNAGILGFGGWSTVSGARIYYGFTGGAGRPLSAAFGWWRQAADVIGESAPFEFFPGLIESEVVTAATPTPTATGDAGSYVVNFNMLVFDDLCDAASWNGDFRRIPPGCASWGPATLRANGTPEPGEAGIPGVTIDLLQGTCTAGSPIGVLSTDESGRIVSAVPALFTAGEYCFVIDYAAHSNAAALRPGRWSVTGTQVIRIPQTIDRDLNLTTTIGWWRSAPGSTASSSAALPMVGSAPIAPAGVAVCAPGSSCAAPPAATPMPDATPDVAPLLEDADPDLVAEIQALFTSLDGRFGGAANVGVLLGRAGEDEAWNLYLYRDGVLFDAGAASDSEEAPSISPDGAQVAYITRDADGNGSLMLLDVESETFLSTFTDSPEMRLVGRAPVWSVDGQSLLFVAQDESGVPSLYQLNIADQTAPPQLVVSDADYPTLTNDGALLAFVRGGNLFVRFLATGSEQQITQNAEGTSCDTPLFDTAGINLYFNCRAGDTVTMYVQGFDGLQAIAPEGDQAVYFSAALDDDVWVFADDVSLYLGDSSAANLLPLVQVEGLQVTGFRWAGR